MACRKLFQLLLRFSWVWTKRTWPNLDQWCVD